MRKDNVCCYVLLSVAFIIVNVITLRNLPPWIDEVMLLDTPYNMAVHGAWSTTAWYRVAGQYPFSTFRRSHYYKGTPHAQFVRWGRHFADVAASMLNPQTINTLRRHQAEGHTVCVVTASIDEWVRPVCERLGVGMVIATRIEVAPDGRLTGRFLSRNCHGPEKVTRLFEVFPHRRAYKLYAYGNSRGDADLLALADEGVTIRPP